MRREDGCCGSRTETLAAGGRVLGDRTNLTAVPLNLDPAFHASRGEDSTTTLRLNFCDPGMGWMKRDLLPPMR